MVAPMTRRLQFAATLFSLMLVLASAAAQSKTIDRVVAAVDGRVITLDQWQQQERFEALMENRKPADVVLGDASLNRLIDNDLIIKNRTSVAFTLATPEEVNQQLIALRKQLDGASTDSGWQRMLAAYQLREDEVKEQITHQLNMLRFLDARFRPGARVTPEQVSAYYRDTFVPQFQKQAPDKKPPALVEVTDRITRIITEQLMDQRFQTWLQNLRAQARVQRMATATEAKRLTAVLSPSQ